MTDLQSIVDHASTIEGWMTKAELMWLAEVAQHMDSIVELGCWKGRSTCALAGACNGPVYAVDHWRGTPSEHDTTHAETLDRDIIVDFRANTRHLSNVRMVVTDIDTAASIIPAVDMIFLDGSHEADSVFDNLNAWIATPRWRVFAGHDLDWPGVRSAVEFIFGRTWRGLYCGAGSIWCVLADGVEPESVGCRVICK